MVACHVAQQPCATGQNGKPLKATSPENTNVFRDSADVLSHLRDQNVPRRDSNGNHSSREAQRSVERQSSVERSFGLGKISRSERTQRSLCGSLYKRNIIGATDAAVLSFTGDARTIQKLKSVRQLAFEFIALLLDRPNLSTIPPEEWNVLTYRQLFDDLSSLEREFRILGDAVETPCNASDKPATNQRQRSLFLIRRRLMRS